LSVLRIQCFDPAIFRKNDHVLPRIRFSNRTAYLFVHVLLLLSLSECLDTISQKRLAVQVRFCHTCRSGDRGEVHLLVFPKKHGNGLFGLLVRLLFALVSICSKASGIALPSLLTHGFPPE